MTTDTPLDLSRYEGDPNDARSILLADLHRRDEAGLLLAECKRLRALAQVALDMHKALGVPFGENVYAEIERRDAEVVALREALTELVAAADWIAVLGDPDATPGATGEDYRAADIRFDNALDRARKLVGR